MLKLIDIISDMFFAPSRGALKAGEKSWGCTLLCLFALVQITGFPILTHLFSVAGKKDIFLLLCFKYILLVICLFVFSSFINTFVDVFYKKTVNIKKLFSGFVFSYVPFLLLPIFAYLVNYEGKIFLFSFVLFLWAINLFADVIRANYDISSFSSYMIICMPFMLLVFFHIVFFMYIGIYMGLSLY